MEHYKKFVEDVLTQAEAAACYDHSAKRGALQTSLKSVRETACSDPGGAILQLRYRHGVSGDYLRASVATLAVLRPCPPKNGGANTQSLDDDDTQSLALYGPRSVEQVRQGVVAAMRARREDNRARAPRILQLAAKQLLLYLVVPAFKDMLPKDADETLQPT